MSWSDLQRSVAASVDAEPELLAHLPALFADLEDLGARARDVVAILGHRGLETSGRVLDLGAGKGAAAIAVARTFGCEVLGIDGHEGFIAHARHRAHQQGVGARCRFDVADIRDAVAHRRGYDLVMMLALGDVLGDISETVEALRQCTVPGGLMLIDDAYLAADADPHDARLQNCHPHDATVAMLTAAGDQILAEMVMDTDENETWCHAMVERIVARAEDLAAANPSLAHTLRAFAERQRSETELLVGPVIGALWLLRRGP